jgi:hypothetical protein
MARHRKTYTGERRTVHLGVQLTPSERAELEFAAPVNPLNFAPDSMSLAGTQPGSSPSSHLREHRRQPVERTAARSYRKPSLWTLMDRGDEGSTGCGMNNLVRHPG